MKRKRKTGLPPGTLIYTGRKHDINVSVSYIEYDEFNCKLEYYKNDEDLNLHNSNMEKVQWYDVRGLHDLDLIQKITEVFGVHTLAAEDIVDVQKRPDYAEYKNGHFITLKTFDFSQETKEIVQQTVSIFFGNSFVLSFQEHEDDIFNEIRERIKNSKGRIRQKGSDYLCYALVDYIVDRYYNIIDSLEEEIELIEEKISLNVDSVNKTDILNNKVKLIKLRKSVVPLREALNQFIRSDSALINEGTKMYLKDVYDHTIQVAESIDSFRDILGGLQDLYISEISLKMNQVMQLLTVVTVIFVPLSFLVGLYGMNFEYIPELKFKNGYFILIGIMILLSSGMLIIFKRKRWF